MIETNEKMEFINGMECGQMSRLNKTLFSRVQILEATLYAVMSVRPCVRPSVRVSVRPSVSIECFSLINHERVVGS